ncbi:coiled-coil domain-containing protein 57 isoform X2 [Thalassophryne amazonica]|nr:coiled-coil domain-containing protein 57 isoform X2 [Thalassophryne amazonica]
MNCEPTAARENLKRLRTEAETTRAAWDKSISQASREMVAKDTEIKALRGKEAGLRTELKKAYEEIERYKQQLSAGRHREHALEQMRVQVELDWQRRCEDTMAEQSLANEQLIQKLIRAKDQVQAKLRDKEQDLQDLTVLLRSVKLERDQAVQGLTPKADYLASEEICRLQEQNRILKAVIIQRTDSRGSHHALRHQVQQHTVQSAASTNPVSTNKITVSSAPPCTDVAPKSSCSGGAVLVNGTSRVAHLELTLDNIIKQSEVLQQLQEDSLCLQKKQLAAACMHGASSGSVHDAKTSGPVLRSRLKQAAYCIARLSKEKQQLIEMGNRLRSQLTIAGVQVPQDSVSVNEWVEAERNPPPHHSPWTQDQLQDLLLTQNSRCTKDSLPRSWSHGSVRVDAGLQSYVSQSGSCWSTEESPSSLRELWELLDHDLSCSISSAGEGELSRDDMTCGISADPQVQRRTRPSKAPPRSTKKTKVSGRALKIRNYNMKD